MNEGQIIEYVEITEKDIEGLKRLLRKDCLNNIVEDSGKLAANYVANYDVGRGAE